MYEGVITRSPQVGGPGHVPSIRLREIRIAGYQVILGPKALSRCSRYDTDAGKDILPNPNTCFEPVGNVGGQILFSATVAL